MKYFNSNIMSLAPIDWSITQALQEIKTLDKRIMRLNTETTFISCGTKNNRLKDDPVHKVISRVQQRNDLKKRRDAIKSAIVISNATTNVKVGSKVYTVAESIERKRSIELDKQLLNNMKIQRNQIKNTVEMQNQQAAQKLQRLLEQNFGKDNTKTDPTSLKQTEDVFWENNRCEYVDPLKLDNHIEQLENEIEEFEKNVDFVLSESNSMTRIQLN